jgi:methyltransferase (TIGR00027 family)
VPRAAAWLDRRTPRVHHRAARAASPVPKGNSIRADRPSTTAALVALCRAAATEGITSVPGFSDPIASLLLPEPFAAASRLLARAVHGRPGVARLLRAASLGASDLLAIRSATIDEALRATSGPPQLVILGAGLDGRPYRLRGLDATTVFEVDHPATQAWKRARVEALRSTAREIRFVPIDFAAGDLGASLAAAGHRADAPTFWIWEGVVMYLRPDEARAVLAQIAARSAPGSRIAATYLAERLGWYALGWLVRAVGEPFRSVLDPAGMARLLGEAGFRVLVDLDGVEQAARIGARPIVPALLRSERVVVAEKPREEGA